MGKLNRRETPKASRLNRRAKPSVTNNGSRRWFYCDNNTHKTTIEVCRGKRKQGDSICLTCAQYAKEEANEVK